MKETTRKILEERAEALAHPLRDAAAETGGRFDAVRFTLAGEEYAFAAGSVREVTTLKDLCPIPCTPPCIIGMINLRGQILTVVNIGPLFDLAREPLNDLSKVLILRADGIEIGILADAISGILSLESEALQTSVPTFEGVRRELLRGVTSGGLIVLDAAKLLSHPALVVSEEVS